MFSRIALWTIRPSRNRFALVPSLPSGALRHATLTQNNPSDDCELPVHSDLLQELRELLDHTPSDRWMTIGSLYNDLSLDSRRCHVRPHRTLAAALSKVQSELGVSLSEDGLMYCKGKAAPTMTSSTHTSKTGAERTEKKDTAEGKCDGGVLFVQPSYRPSVPDAPPPVDFYYDVGLRQYPPPAPDFHVTNSTLPPPRPTESGTVLSVGSFVAFIPPFFVPLTEVLAQMPGYTEEHVEMYLKHSTTELVNVFGKKYIRLYGGYAKVPLDGCEVSEAQFAQYRPDPKALQPFIAAFGGVTERWMPLRILLERTGSEAVARLPFRGPAAIIYFAQMQHVFAFAMDRDGGSVLLRREGYGGLECETTPTPKSCNAILRVVPLEGQIDIQQVEDTLSEPVREEIALFYGNIKRFLQFHAAVFWLSADGTVIMRRRSKNRHEIAQLTLEEQLEIAVKDRNKKKIRSLRRHIAFKNDPSHPFHDPDNLAREIHRYLPRKGHVPLKIFLKKNVPEELLNYLPRKFWNFFTNYPQYFQHFEYQVAGQWCVSRPGQPLPRGVIRQEFSEEDLVRLVAEYLQQRGSRACSNIILHLPRGAQEAVRKRYGGMYYLVTEFPQYFNVVLSSDIGNVQSSATVHLVELPGAEFVGKTVKSHSSNHNDNSNSHNNNNWRNAVNERREEGRGGRGKGMDDDGETDDDDDDDDDANESDKDECTRITH